MPCRVPLPTINFSEEIPSLPVNTVFDVNAKMLETSANRSHAQCECALSHSYHRLLPFEG